MKFENLLDKREQMQVELLRRLIQTNGRTSIQKLALDCNISRPSLDTYLQSLEDLGSQMGKSISISRLENDVVLELDKRLSFNEIVEFLLLDATKYRFMRLLLENQELNMIDLSEKLLVSESTLFRKIKELNHDLKEFNLQIKNNKLIGNEEQIRYFYFLLFNGVQKGKRPAYLLRTEEKTKFILHAEESLRLSFSEVNKDQISCWMGIAEQRNKFTAIKKEFLLAQKQIYQNDHLYQLLDSLFYQEIYQNSDINHCETMLFYSFCVSFFILNQEDDYRFNIFRSKQIPAVMLNVTIREKMLAHYHI
ncbi:MULTISPECIES: helix-turn-helix domain-containing protein [unclassified Lactococcus]|uniref:helix-turn-helix domain-containing protein n=1 Tax=unclassified Lactococcus TaxID=2643510 RepID=UPI0011CAEC0C|nr:MULTISPECIES: helix-turn-helix domain-containing protein [unclassified Lactococcus]MQW23396.1 hypothetical protein [Lactococcus sp. dk101]TXK37905.1 helix-turn-helix domain-containing protein [Lactococcus sp. dk310]TXK49559.1 helix-turn-helix domain-containing protein [Lactococcus sp. dk322]